MEKLAASAGETQGPGPLSFTVVGRVAALTSDFFEDDVPILQKSDAEIMCYKASIADATGRLPVKIWDKPCHDIFGVTANCQQQCVYIFSFAPLCVARCWAPLCLLFQVCCVPC
ncbi:unnamed protein product [Prorocentrum cordatum]|uniref:Uncharacterized protein n=1 Tax=Prorocentrum cordatum TaxID=2364126 RepID=A0ABN9U0N9_9DINO|nr:unnamed protein product [Polarella glacialis]